VKEGVTDEQSGEPKEEEVIGEGVGESKSGDGQKLSLSCNKLTTSC